MVGWGGVGWGRVANYSFLLSVLASSSSCSLHAPLWLLSLSAIHTCFVAVLLTCPLRYLAQYEVSGGWLVVHFCCPSLLLLLVLLTCLVGYLAHYEVSGQLVVHFCSVFALSSLRGHWGFIANSSFLLSVLASCCCSPCTPRWLPRLINYYDVSGE